MRLWGLSVVLGVENVDLMKGDTRWSGFSASDIELDRDTFRNPDGSHQL